MNPSGGRLGRRLMVSVAVVLAFCCGWADSVEAQTVVLASVRDTVLENGLQVIVAPNSHFPIAWIEVVVRSGAFTQLEQPDEGLPHMLEHMLFKRKGGDWWSDRVWDLQAVYNGMTSAEMVAYYLILPADKLDDGIKVIGELVRSPQFSGDALEDEREVVQGELQRMVSDPEAVADMSIEMALWGHSFRQKNAIGNMLTIGGATTDQLEDHVKRYYVPNNAALIVTGDVGAAEVFESAGKHLERWRRGDDPLAELELPPIAPLGRDTAFVIRADAANVTFMIRWQGPSVSEDRDATFAADLLSELVNQPTSGTQRRLVDTGLFTDVSMRYITLNHVGPIELTARTTPEVLGRACAALQRELVYLGRENYFGEADLEAAKKGARVDAALDWQRTGALAQSIAATWSVAGLDYFLEYFDRLSERTVDDVRGYLAKYITGRPKVVGLLTSSAARRAQGNAIRACMANWGTS
jgi:zinc protease